MEPRSVVILYGASLPLAGLETCLRELPGIKVIQFDHQEANAEREIRKLKPEAIIFDSLDPETSSWPPLAQLLKDLPQTVLIGFDGNSSELMILSGHRHNGENLDDVLFAIRGRPRSS
jgi:hypothetical protein